MAADQSKCASGEAVIVWSMAGDPSLLVGVMLRATLNQKAVHGVKNLRVTSVQLQRSRLAI
jgi:hypothetical protein